MIISHKYKFIFIKTRKTAGTSIEVFLSQHCGEDDIVTPIRPHVEPHQARNHKGLWNPIPEITRGDIPIGIKKSLSNLLHREKYYNHIPASLLKLRISPEIWNSYFKFCVERNPWDKTLSHYHMLNNLKGGNLTFFRYLERKKLCFNYPQYIDSKGSLLVDKVVRFESLMEDLDAVFKKLGVPFDKSLGVKAKSEHRKDRTPYQDVFSDSQKDFIQEAFAKEIEMHGYVF